MTLNMICVTSYSVQSFNIPTNNRDICHCGYAIDYTSFSDESKAAYMVTQLYMANIDVTISDHLKGSPTLRHFFNYNKIDASYVNNVDSLVVGDIIHVHTGVARDSNCSSYLIYRGRDSNGGYILEDLYRVYIFTEDYFIHTLNHNDTTRIRDMRYHPKQGLEDVGEPLPLPPSKKDQPPIITEIYKSATQSTVDEWNNWRNNARIIDTSNDIKTNVDVPQGRDPRPFYSFAIWLWMHGTDHKITTRDEIETYNNIQDLKDRHIWWHDHKDTTCTINNVFDTHHGNCCEQARLVVYFARAMGTPARFVHRKDMSHVWAQIRIGDGAMDWKDLDTSHSDTSYGRYFDSWNDGGRRYLQDIYF